MASALNLGLAAVAGLAVGAGATLAFARDRPSTTAGGGGASFPVQQTRPAPNSSSSPATASGLNGATFDSWLTGVALARRVTDPISIGEEEKAKPLPSWSAQCSRCQGY